MALLLFQFPKLLISLFVQHNASSFSGFFSNVFTIIATVMIFVNYERARTYQERLREQAITDRLTGIPNRFACTELMDDLLKKGEAFCIAVLNLNNFKNIKKNC